MAPPLIQLKDISLAFGAKQLLSGLSLSIREKDQLALVGRNGTGKSSLMKMIAGALEPDTGEVVLTPGTTVTYLSQNPSPNPDMSIRDYVATGLNHISQDEWHRIDALLEEVQLDGSRECGLLSGGELRRASLARAFVSEPDLLLLDEPTNHLDLPAIEWLEKRLNSYRGALMVISHDRAFLARISSACLWLSGGRLRHLDKGFKYFDDWVEEQLQREEEERHKRKKQIERENRWLARGVTARRKRNQGRLSRLMALRQERARDLSNAQSASTDINMSATSSKVSGRQVILAKNISKRFGERVLFEHYSTIIRRKDRIGIIGPNGAGKTTLLKILLGEMPPDEGTVRLGSNLEILRIDQKREELDEDMTCREVLTGGSADQIMVRGEPKNVAGYMKEFLFDGAQVESPVRSLSGGERNRLLLAKSLAKSANFIVLDEPTNDLDMETLDLLENVLGEFDGTVLIVSHDRAFLDNLVTSIVAFETDEVGNGTIIEHAGGYSDYLERRAAEAMQARSTGGSTTPRTVERPQSPKDKPSQRSQRLSYKHQRALDTLPKEIDALGKVISRLEAELGNPDIYTKDREQYDKLCQKLDEARQLLVEKEEAWLEVEMLREEIEAQN